MNVNNPDALPVRGFPQSEFEARTRSAQERMRARSLDALLVMTEPEVRYYSGFHTLFWLSPARPWFLVVPARGKPIAVIPGIGRSSMSDTWISDIRTWSAPRPEDDGISLLVETLKEVVTQKGRIGVPMGHETHVRMPAGDFDKLRSLLGEIKLVDATDIVRAQRMVKSPAEIDKISHVCRIASDAFEGFPDLIHIGDSERRAFTKFRIDLLQRGADDVPYLVGSSGPGGFYDVIKQPTDRSLEKGDMLLFDTGAVFDGYYCDFDRNYAFGHATDEMKRAYAVVYEATEAGLATVRPGVKASDLWAAMAKVLSDHGSQGSDVGRLGHGLGMQLTEWPSHTRNDHTVIEEGMVLTLEPGMKYGTGMTMLHEENLVVRADGPELLTHRAPPELPVIN